MPVFIQIKKKGSIMQYRSFDLTNKFIVNVATYNELTDEQPYNTHRTVFDNSEFEMITSIITILQDINNKYFELVKESKGEYLTSLSKYDYPHQLIKLYLKNQFNVNITENDTENILYTINKFIYEYHPCNELSDIIIIKDNKLLKILEPTTKDIEQAVEYITNNLNTLTIK